jgi:hypothetical protein
MSERKPTKPPRACERISADIALDDQLTEADVQLLITLEMKAGESRLAKATLPWLAEQIGRHPKTVLRGLQKAVQRGYIIDQDRDNRGRLLIRLRPTLTPWVLAPRWFLASDRPFWQKHALLVILAQHRAGGGYSIRKDGKKLGGIIRLCHLRRNTDGGRDERQARRLLDDFVRELVDLRLIALIDRPTGARPATCQVNRRRLRAPHLCPDPTEGAKGAEDRGGELAVDKGGDVVGMENKFSIPSSSRDRRSLPLRLPPQAREGIFDPNREKTGGRQGEPAGDSPPTGAADIPVSDSLVNPPAGGRPRGHSGGRDGTAVAAGAILPASGPSESSTPQGGAREAPDNLRDTIGLLKDVEARCRLARSKNLDSYGDDQGYRYLASAFLELAVDFLEGWDADDVVRGVGKVINGFSEPAWGLLLLATVKDKSGKQKVYRYRDRLVGQIKEATKNRQDAERREAWKRDPAYQAEQWLSQPGILLSGVARADPSMRYSDRDWFAALAMDMFPEAAFADQENAGEVAVWALRWADLSEEQLEALKADYLDWYDKQPRPPS